MKIQSRLGVTIPEAASSGTDHIAVTVNDGDTVNFTASGTDLQTITAEVIIDPTVDNITVATTNGIYTKLIDEVTYAELAALISGSDLIQGRQYLITDYQTVHTIPGTADTNTGSLDPLIVTATYNNQLSPIAQSTTYPQDIVYYSHSNADTNVVNGATKGFIYRRIDTDNNIDVPFDYKAVKFRRWKLDVSAAWDIGTTYNATAVVLGADGNVYLSMKAGNTGNDPTTDLYWWYKFPFTNAEYCALSSASITSPSSHTVPVSALYQDVTLFSTIPSNVKITYMGYTVTNKNISYFNMRILTAHNVVINSHGNATGTFKSISKSIIDGYQFTLNYVDTIVDSQIYSPTFTSNLLTIIDNCSITGQIEGCILKTMDRCTVLASASLTFVNVNPSALSAFVYNTFYGRISGLTMLYTTGVSFRNNNFYGLDSVLSSTDFTTATLVLGNYTKDIIRRSDGTARIRYVDGSDVTTFAAVNT